MGPAQAKVWHSPFSAGSERSPCGAQALSLPLDQERKTGLRTRRHARGPARKDSVQAKHTVRERGWTGLGVLGRPDLV